MSGGEYNYVYIKIKDFAERLATGLDEEGTSRPERWTSERLAFASLLKRVAEAAKDIEWVDSGDKSPGDENAAIRECFKYAAITVISTYMDSKKGENS